MGNGIADASEVALNMLQRYEMFTMEVRIISWTNFSWYNYFSQSTS
jgi:hypothetical protein